jgi:hypothetical protein
MGIQIEFNPDLALRAFATPGRLTEECLPKELEIGAVYSFLKKGQRNYWLEGEIPLVLTEGNGKLSRPLASIQILEVNQFLQQNKVYTSGQYRVISVFKDDKIHFEGFNRI